MWAALHAGNIKRGGEWIETGLLASRSRTNPWFWECDPRILAAGDMLALDTDLVGTYGCCCEISRSWVVGEAPPTANQKQLHQITYEHIITNLALIEAGMSFAEMANIAHRLPEAYRALRYGLLAHGIGLCDEYPSVRYPEEVEAYGYGDVFGVGMTLSFEAFVGAVDGHEGVKLEEQVLVTDNGVVPLSSYLYEAAMLA
jgi:Xaa-Pro aminopeptidase